MTETFHLLWREMLNDPLPEIVNQAMAYTIAGQKAGNREHRKIYYRLANECLEIFHIRRKFEWKETAGIQ